MDTRKKVSDSVRHLLLSKSMSTDELADLLDISPVYVPRKLREDRWSLEDIDRLAEVFDVSPSAIVSGSTSPVSWEPAVGPNAPKLFEITFQLADGSELTCLEAAQTSMDAINAITSVWRPNVAIEKVSFQEKRYFSVHV